MSPKAGLRDFQADAEIGNILEQGEGYFVVPILITREDVYEYQGDGALKPWEQLEKVSDYDGTKFIAHHPLSGQTQDEIPVWGEIRNTVKNAEQRCISAELVVDETAASEKFCLDAKAGKAQPISWGFAARREAEEGEHNGKPYKFVDYDMSSRHVAYAPAPWKARCSKCATNKVTPDDAEGSSMEQNNDSLINSALLPDKIDELLLLPDDFELGRKARVFLAQLRAGMQGVESMDAIKEEKKEEQEQAEHNDATPAVPAVEPKVDIKIGAESDMNKTPIVQDAEPKKAAQETPAVDPLAKLAELLDAKLNPVIDRIAALETVEADRKKLQNDAEYESRSKEFNDGLSEGGKAENLKGELFKAFNDAEDKFAFMRQMDAKNLLQHEIAAGEMQGSDAFPPIGGDEAGRKRRVAEWGKKYYPGYKPENKGA